jgi:hypothetical protein
MNNIELWERYKKYLYFNTELGLMIDISWMNFPGDYFNLLGTWTQKAFRGGADL